MKSYKLAYKLEQESLNSEIDKALNDYHSKNGGVGGNRPDAKLLLQDKNLNFFPILIEYKGYKDKLIKLDSEGHVDNRTVKNEPNLKNINRFINRESQLKRVFVKIMDDLGIYYKIGLTADSTGKLFNEMYGWLGFSQDKLNDVALTPSYVGNFLVKLARVNKDSFVWDFTSVLILGTVSN